jgi:hypothetical protein
MGFTIETELKSEQSMTFTVYTILRTDEAGKIYWQKDQGGCGGIPTTLLSEAEIFMRGTVQWDGCSNWTIDPNHGLPLHFCGVDDALRLSELWQWIYNHSAANIPNW